MRDSENPETLRFHPEPSKDQSGAQDANGYNENCPDKRHSIQMLYAGRGIALRISCSHAGAMRRRRFLCARNRLAVVAVCNTTRYR